MKHVNMGEHVTLQNQQIFYKLYYYYTDEHVFEIIFQGEGGLKYLFSKKNFPK